MSRRRHSAFELLEPRAMLTVAQDIVAEITPYQQAISTALDVVTSLPLVGKQLAGLSELDSILQNSLANVESLTQSITNDGSYQISVPLPGLSKTFSFDLGLDAFLKATAVGSVHAAINPTLNIGFDYQNGEVSLNTAQTNLDVGFDVSLPGFQGTFSFNGLLYAKAIDVGTNFHGDLKFSFDGGSGVSTQISGDAHILMGLSLSFVDPALDVSFNPTFHTTLDLDWGINPANNQLNAPSIQLKDFGLDADSFIHGFLGDVVKTVQKFTKPIQPFIDVFQEPVPIISAFGSSETFGDLMLQGAGLSKAQQDSFNTMIQIINAVNAIDLSGGTGGAVIPFGTINLTGNAQQVGAFGFDTSQISGAIDDILNSPALQFVEDKIETVANYVGLTSTAGFQFPLLENPGPVIGAILTGQTETMFSFSTGRQHFELAPSVGVGIKDLFGIFLSAGVVFDADLTMGYDTAGLVALAQDPSHNPADLLHGFYFDNSVDPTAPPIPNVPELRKTGLYLQGFMELSASAILTISGGLYANINVELVNTDASDHVHLDTMIGNLAGGGKVFKLSGKLYASADLELTLPDPIGPDITLFSYNLGYDELLNFDPPPQQNFSVPVTIVDVTNEHSLKLDVSKLGVGSRVTTVQPFHDLPLMIGGNTVEADGIRVDYPGEIFFYIERKNDLTSNYYNFVDLNGAAPDGITVNVIDPFRMFADEGAPNPAPAQTQPAVLLVGGRNVAYKYTETASGSHPHVVLAGGFGSNTLSGGTMMFGNFIPADRLAQAKGHFGDTSGFDGNATAAINSQIDAAVAPANPAGVIGSQLTGGRGGLMVGGAGNNSFFASGPGAYEMIGGSWVNSFSVSPSFGGVPATYFIDGGPGGDNSLIVRVPGDEHVTFENSTIVDKYNPAFKALAVQANAGLSITAHGITKAKIVAESGSRVVIGDTSELNIEFSISGGAHLTFGGTNAPDLFDVSTSGSFYDAANHYTPPKWANTTSGLQIPAQGGFGLPARMADPIYSITRTFGTNGRVQTIPFDIGDAAASSIELDAGGASDTYNLTQGVGGFIDVTVNDSGSGAQNSLTVNVRDSVLVLNQATLTDNALHLDYYTDVVFHDALATTSSGIWDFFAYSSSVHYTPSVYFGANVNLTFATPFPFAQTVIDRPNAPQSQTATILIDGQYYTSYVPYQSFGPLRNIVFNTLDPSPVYQDYSLLPHNVEIQANAGNLNFQQRQQLAYAPGYIAISVFNIHSNTGAITFDSNRFWSDGVENYNVLGNSGTLNFNSTITGVYQFLNLSRAINIQANAGTVNVADFPANLAISGITTQVNIGGAQGLAGVHGTVNLTAQLGSYGLKIDDRGNSGSATAWTIDNAITKIGDLTITHAVSGSFFSKYEAFASASSPVTIFADPYFFTRQLNGVDFPTWGLYGSAEVDNRIGDLVSLTTNVYGTPDTALTYSASNLPPGLSISPTTGLISGAIDELAFQSSPYTTLLFASNGTITRGLSLQWNVASAIDILVPLPNNLIGHELSPLNLAPITTTNALHQPVSLSVSGLPPGLSFDPNTGAILGAIELGAGQHGPYHVTINATDGMQTASTAFDLPVTGITIAAPPLKATLAGDSVQFQLQATSVSGMPVALSVQNLPEGLVFDPATGIVSGVATNANGWFLTYNTTVIATQGSDVTTMTFKWSIVPILSDPDIITFYGPGNRTDHEGDTIYAGTAYSSYGLPIYVEVQGNLPAGVKLIYYSDFDYYSIEGVVQPGAASGSPYEFTVLATDGLSSSQQTFNWTVTPPVVPGDFDSDGDVDGADFVAWQVHYPTSSGATSAQGDADGNGSVDGADFAVWQDQFASNNGAPSSGTASSSAESSSAESAIENARGTESGSANSRNSAFREPDNAASAAPSATGNSPRVPSPPSTAASASQQSAASSGGANPTAAAEIESHKDANTGVSNSAQRIVPNDASDESIPPAPLAFTEANPQRASHVESPAPIAFPALPTITSATPSAYRWTGGAQTLGPAAIARIDHQSLAPAHVDWWFAQSPLLRSRAIGRAVANEPAEDWLDIRSHW